jgi:exodeoxyribonuclease-1
MKTFLWHDYETFGINPRRDRPSQFAAIRTDADLHEIGDPIMHYCQPAPDYLPDPQSCLITGITPQHCLEHGIPEYQFAAAIEQVLAQSGTVGVGYNTIRFDDEVTRFMFWRNLIDPYAREWQNDCGRWDLLDVVRTAYALRPEGIEWPTHPDGRPSFKLEQLTVANGITHEAAHDALSDVRATISMARLIKQKQPKLFQYCFEMYKKDRVATEIGLSTPRPFLHISGMFPADRGCMAIMWPLGLHPTNKNEIIAWDLAADPTELWSLDAESIRKRMFSKSEDLPEGVTRLPVKSIHTNKSPVVINNLKILSPDMAERWGIDVEAALRHAKIAEAAPPMSTIWQQVFQREKEATPDVDEDLYGGFIGNRDRGILSRLRTLSPEALKNEHPSFDDARLEELLFRYRARNFPQSLSTADMQRWEEHRASRLFDGEAAALTIENLFARIDTLSETIDERGEHILGALYDYAEGIAPARK